MPSSLKGVTARASGLRGSAQDRQNDRATPSRGSLPYRVDIERPGGRDLARRDKVQDAVLYGDRGRRTRRVPCGVDRFLDLESDFAFRLIDQEPPGISENAAVTDVSGRQGFGQHREFNRVPADNLKHEMTRTVDHEAASGLVTPPIKIIAGFVFLIDRYECPRSDDCFANGAAFARARRGNEDAREEQYQKSRKPRPAGTHAGHAFRECQPTRRRSVRVVAAGLASGHWYTAHTRLTCRRDRGRYRSHGFPAREGRPRSALRRLGRQGRIGTQCRTKPRDRPRRLPSRGTPDGIALQWKLRLVSSCGGLP